MALQDTFELAKEELIAQSHVQMDQHFSESRYTHRQKLALTCRILFETDTTRASRARSPRAPARRASTSRSGWAWASTRSPRTTC